MAITDYGDEAQINMAVEEMAELTDKLMKDKRGRTTKAEIVEEIADVTIMMRQLALMYGVDDVAAEVDNKLHRLFGRMQQGEH